MTRARCAASITDFESELGSWETLLQSCVSGGPECALDTKVTPSGFCEGTLPIPCLLGTRKIHRGSDPQQLLEAEKDAQLLIRKCLPLLELHSAGYTSPVGVKWPSGVIQVIQGLCGAERELWTLCRTHVYQIKSEHAGEFT